VSVFRQYYIALLIYKLACKEKKKRKNLMTDVCRDPTKRIALVLLIKPTLHGTFYMQGLADSVMIVVTRHLKRSCSFLTKPDKEANLV
jgi:hypothetical protein